jgi:hypothetical protein
MISRSVLILGMLFATNAYSLPAVQAASIQHNQSDKFLIAKDEKTENNQDLKNRELNQHKPSKDPAKEKIKPIEMCTWRRFCGPRRSEDIKLDKSTTSP